MAGRTTGSTPPVARRSRHGDRQPPGPPAGVVLRPEVARATDERLGPPRRGSCRGLTLAGPAVHRNVPTPHSRLVAPDRDPGRGYGGEPCRCPARTPHSARSRPDPGVGASPVPLAPPRARRAPSAQVGAFAASPRTNQASEEGPIGEATCSEPSTVPRMTSDAKAAPPQASAH
jgi:hypothetical protein